MINKILLKMRTTITCLLLLIGTLLTAQGLVINEFVASNDSTSNIMDDFGEYDDWVELYNNSTNAIDLSGYYFSDDIAEPNKWQFPNGISIDGGGYLIVWTDSDDEQGDLHTSFKLSKSGEALIISDASQMVLDSITFGEQETNVTMSRIPNGTGDFVPRAATFNENNESLSANNLPVRTDFEVYPNPTQSNLQIDFTKTEEGLSSAPAILHIVDTSGKIVLAENMDRINQGTIKTLDLHTLARGLYVLKIQTETEVFLKKIMLEKHD